MKRSLFLSIFGLALLTAASAATGAGGTKSPIILDAKGNVRSFYGVPITLTRARLKRLPYAVRKRHYYAEGDRYTNHKITARNNVEVVVNFNDDGTFYDAWTETRGALGPNGIKIGSSTLADVKAAFPGGEFIYYFEDGYVCTYITPTNVSFMFDPKDMPRGAFDHDRPVDFPVPDSIKVKTIAVFSKPAPPHRESTPPGDENKAWITEETSGDRDIITRAGGGAGDESLHAGAIVSRLDLEQTPGTQLVRLVWTVRGKIEVDRLIDVSAYPEFDIWTGERVWRPDKVTFSFRYGRFKDCSAISDDREKVYVTLSGEVPTLSSSPPPGVQIDNRWALKKYVGHSMNSAAHGCRRTYDPKTGAFGLENVQ